MNEKHLNYLLTCIIIVLALCLTAMYNKSIWNDFFECDLMLEQRVACYAGCNRDFDDGFVKIKGDGCIEYCQNRYYVVFNDEGGIDWCKYWGGR